MVIYAKPYYEAYKSSLSTGRSRLIRTNICEGMCNVSLTSHGTLYLEMGNEGGMREQPASIQGMTDEAEDQLNF